MPPRKRAASTVLDEPRRSRRISSTAKTSNYFQDDEDSDDLLSGKGSEKSKRDRASTTNRRVEVEDNDSDVYEEDDSEQDEAGGSGDEGEEENEEEDADDSDMDTKVTVVKVPGLRPEGGMKYADEYVHKNTMLFLKDLKQNNERSWLKTHDGEFRRAFKDWESFVVSFTSTLSGLDFTIPELPARDVVFRIYRDTRFSKDSTPYKPHFSAAWSRTGKKGPFACYYVHAEPGGCFVGGGLYHPESEVVQKLRESIDERPRRWRRILNEPGLKKQFLPSASKSSKPEVALKAFAERNKDNALKVRPKGYAADHRDIALLKLKNYVLGTKIPDSVIFGPGSQEKLAEIFRPMVPFVSFLNSIARPDPNVDEDDSGDDEDEAERDGESGDEEDEDDEDK
ncbi:uncharacterized protein DNG_07597 [Cephalotrichum gorgonifer]|uniref:DUF2461 domain-containing protein n=1 Tax=Cephalotrichum gorgonifer TaxID=2041049 RepID=A0AAE8N2P6_9PEZI|nr:uncharacterized protein DNG_07597 [Cephalotrichum gorgonifer]